jgi:hypothetical protein
MPVRYDIASMVPQSAGGIDPLNALAQMRQQEMADAQMNQMALRGYYQDLAAQRAAEASLRAGETSQRQTRESEIRTQLEQEKLLAEKMHRVFSTIGPKASQDEYLKAANRFNKDDPEFADWLKSQQWNEDLYNRLTIPAEKLAERKFEKGPEGSGAMLETRIGQPPQYVFPTDPEQQRIMEREGTGKNPMSSARGVGQFIDSTFVDTYRKTFPDQARGLTEGLPEDRAKARILAQRGTMIDAQTPIEVPMLNTFTRENKNALSRANIDPTPGNTRLAHFLGAGGAINVLKANPNTPVESLISPDAIQANPTVLRGKTAGQVTAWANKQMEDNLTPSKLEPLGSNKREAQDGALEFLRAFEYDPETGESRPAQLLAKTKGGQINRIFQDIGSRFGIGSEAYDAEGRLTVAGRQALLAKVGGSLGGKSFTDEDRKFVMEAIGGLDDSSKDVGYRMSRLDEAMRMMTRVAKVPYKPPPELENVRGVLRETPTVRGKAGETAKPSAPKAGAVEDGYRFKGGDPSNPANWEKQ